MICFLLLSQGLIAQNKQERQQDEVLVTRQKPNTQFGSSVKPQKTNAPLLTEDFSSTTFPPAGWARVDANGDGVQWLRSGGAGQDGAAGRAYIPYNSTSTEAVKDDYLFTSAISLTAGTTYRLQFYMMILDPNYPERYEVSLSTTQTAAGIVSSISGVVDVETAAEEWVLRTYDFTPTTTGNFYVSFHAQSDADMYNIYMDNISLDLKPTGPPSCVAYDFAAGEANAPVGGFNYSWKATLAGGDPTTHDVYFGTSTNPPKVVDNAAWSMAYATGSLMNNTTYYIKVVPRNAQGEATGCTETTFNAEDFANAGGGHALSGGYYFANSLAGGNLHGVQPTYSWVDMSAGTAVTLDDDEVTPTAIALPFTFPFFGASITHVCISSNGFLHMRTSNAACPTAAAASNLGLPVESLDGGLLALFWDDLDPSAGGTIKYLSGSAGKFIVAFENVPRFNDPADLADAVTAQVVLFPSGKIRMQYNLPATTVVDAAGAGISKVDGSAFVRYADGGTGGALRSSPVAVAYAMTIPGLASDVATSLLEENPNETALFSLYPNPFAQNATLKLQVNQTQNVKVELYNVLGQKVQTVFEGAVEAMQNQELQLQKMNLSNGQYFVRITGDNFVKHQSVIIMN